MTPEEVRHELTLILTTDKPLITMARKLDEFMQKYSTWYEELDQELHFITTLTGKELKELVSTNN